MKKLTNAGCQSELVEDLCGEACPPWFDELTMTSVLANKLVTSYPLNQPPFFYS